MFSIAATVFVAVLLIVTLYFPHTGGFYFLMGNSVALVNTPHYALQDHESQLSPKSNQTSFAKSGLK